MRLHTKHFTQFLLLKLSNRHLYTFFNFKKSCHLLCLKTQELGEPVRIDTTPLTCEKAFHISQVVFLLQKKTHKIPKLYKLPTNCVSHPTPQPYNLLHELWLRSSKMKKIQALFLYELLSEFHPSIIFQNFIRHEHGLDPHYRSLKRFLYLSLTRLAVISTCFTGRMYLRLSLAHFEPSSNIIFCD